jgi:hypothetical protein
MPDFTPDDIDIDPSEFVDACNKREISELIDALIEDGYIKPEQVSLADTKGIPRVTLADKIYLESLEHLTKCRDLLSIHEENYINNMAAKYKHLR